MTKGRRKKKGGRYTPPQSSQGYRSEQSMTPKGMRMLQNSDASGEELAFFADGVTPVLVYTISPTDDDESVDPTLPPTLVAIIDQATWPSSTRVQVRDLMALRSAHPGEEWFGAVDYGIGWSTMLKVGEPGKTEIAATKLKLELRGPIVFKQSFIFDLTQVLAVIKPVANGGLFAVGTMDQVEYLREPGRNYADVLELLPVFTLPASDQLSVVVDQLERRLP
jgi:hypothetical protein